MVLQDIASRATPTAIPQTSEPRTNTHFLFQVQGGDVIYEITSEAYERLEQLVRGKA